MIESLKCLYEAAEGYEADAETQSAIDALLGYAKLIQDEVDYRYMELPVDADGVPIHVGDTLQLGDTRGEVVALTYCPSNGKLPWEWQCDTGDWYNTAFARHVRPRTVEDVLDDFSKSLGCKSILADIKRKAIAKYAAELRELLGGERMSDHDWHRPMEDSPYCDEKLLSLPPMYRWTCSKCGKVAYRDCSKGEPPRDGCLRRARRMAEG